MKLISLSLAVLLFLSVPGAFGLDVPVRDGAEFREAVMSAKPGTRVVLAPGSYGGGYQFTGLHGEPGKPIIIAAADPAQPPVFNERAVGIHLSKPAYVELHDLRFERHSGNGINVDDGGDTSAAAHHLTFRGLQIRDIGGPQNADGIKLSGVEDFIVADCSIERWGTRGGSAIDMVGCHRGVIEKCVFRHDEAPEATGVQSKGGSSEIAIRRNTFENAGGRAVNIGGSTGLPYFRPPVKDDAENAEALNIRVEGNRFSGSMTPIAFVGVDSAFVRFNTIEQPGRWAVRILQENQDPRFVPCRNGEFADNLVIFESGKWSEGGVNVGGKTSPGSFKFARNWWLCLDRPDRSQPRLPVPETDGVYGRPASEAKGKAGADAFTE
uniref:Right handed beta helix domain-containing protein n=1 Tax=uncultured Verrucomicrobiota bacterium TaxID=156588 RepID=D2DXP7_9BACT|nr:hypothetical protein [uncultured Verrucomicrobiota bacterium]